MALLKSAILFFSLLWAVTACTRHPSPTQMNDLEMAEQAADAAERQLSALESEYSQLQSELEREKTILSRNQSELSVVNQKLGK